MCQDQHGKRSEKLPSEGDALLIEGRIEQLQRDQAEGKKRDEEYKRLQIRYNKLVAWFTGGLLLTSLIMVVIYHDMAGTSAISANAAKRAADIAKDTLHVSERAYIIVGAPQLDLVKKVASILFH